MLQGISSSPTVLGKMFFYLQGTVLHNHASTLCFLISLWSTWHKQVPVTFIGVDGPVSLLQWQLLGVHCKNKINVLLVFKSCSYFLIQFYPLEGYTFLFYMCTLTIVKWPWNNQTVSVITHPNAPPIQPTNPVAKTFLESPSRAFLFFLQLWKK